MTAPTVYLAHLPGAPAENCLLGSRGVPRLPDSARPSLLVSAYYLDGWLRQRSLANYRSWIMDSGAFTAHQAGSDLDVEWYAQVCAKVLCSSHKPEAVFSLDVVGDWRATLQNTEYLWNRGIEAIPCYHQGEPWEALRIIARDYPRIAIGGVVGVKITKKNDWAMRCFEQVWPKKIHGFGFGSRSSIEQMPFHSVDASTWQSGPTMFGRWQSFGNAVLGIRGSAHDLRSEIELHLKWEREARLRWAPQMKLLEDLNV